VNERQDDWDELLPLAEFSYNNHRRHPRMGFEPQQPWSHVKSANEFVERMAKGVEEAKAALTKAKEEYYNR
jgi:hypothetical protein